MQALLREFADLNRRIVTIAGEKGWGPALRLSYQMLRGRPAVLRVPADGFGYGAPNDLSQFIHLAESEAKVRAIAEAVPGDARWIVDLGANVGLFSRLALQRCPAAEALCVEADPRLCRLIEQNLAGAGAHRVLAKLVATASASGQRFHVDPGNSQTGSAHRQAVALAAAGRELVALEVDAIAVDEVLDGRPVDFLKVDLQGSEAELFLGREELFRAVRMCCFEITFLDDGAPELYRFLKGLYPHTRIVNRNWCGADILFCRAAADLGA